MRISDWSSVVCSSDLRASGLHGVLGQAKRGIVLDLKKPEAVALARALAAKSDVLIENYATGVMDRLGLGAEAVRAASPDLIYVSASGFGRTGPQARAVRSEEHTSELQSLMRISYAV